MAESVVGSASADKGSPCPPPDGPGDGMLLPRPPTDGRPVTLSTGGTACPDDVFEVAYCNERYRFGEGAWGRFGRDDSVCEITVWNEIRDVSLSRVAGEVWCVDGQLWVRNLSASHELVIGGGGRPQWLGPREQGTRGAACSIPSHRAVITAPSTGSWALTVASLLPADTGVPTGGTTPPPGHGPTTVRVEPVPDRFASIASALCAPLLSGRDVPATYDEVAQNLGISQRQARRYVEQLCDHYRSSLPEKVLSPPAEGLPAYLPLARLLVARGLVRET